MDLPSVETVISKLDVEKVILSWADGQLSSDELYEWVNENFFPASQEIAPDEHEHTRLALSLILNEFESTKPEGYRSQGAGTAIDFINTPLSDFRNRLERFLDECFTGSVSSDEIERVMERHRSILSDR